jgi:hypothetical protein
MVAAIADILKAQIAGLDWIERFGGLVIEAKKPDTRKADNGDVVTVGWQSWPVACDVNAERCFEDQAKLKWFIPESSLAAVAYFVDNGGTSFVGFDEFTPRRGGLIYRFNLKFVVWMNMKRLGDAITSGECWAADKLVPYVISEFFGTAPDAATTVFGADTPKARAYRRIEVTSVSQIQKSPQIFAPFSFWNLPDKQAMFVWPYDYFALQIQGTFVLNRFCLPELYEPPFVADTDICLPAEPTDDYRVTTDGEHRQTTEEELRIAELD